MFQCTMCGQLFELTGKRKTKEYCSRKCYKKDWARNNPTNRYEKNKHKVVERTYGIKPRVYAQMQKEYKGCEICGNKVSTPHIDHCHKTGTVRGMLCKNCNTGLGHFKDDVKLLNLAIQYLSR